MTAQLPQGWYQDPQGPPGTERWWNGTHWTEHGRGISGAPTQSKNQPLVNWGWATWFVGLVLWPVFLAPFVIGIILAARGVSGHGAALIVLSVIGPAISILVISTYIFS